MVCFLFLFAHYLANFAQPRVMKNLFSILIICGMLFSSLPVVSLPEKFSESDESVQVEEVYENYIINDEDGNFLTEKRGVALGDIIIIDFNKFEIVFVDDENLVAVARFVEKIERPKVHKKQMENVADVVLNKSLGLYSTHNDESYIIGDGTESVYGAGGIHDIARLLAQNLRQKQIDVDFDETLHIPHNSSAYVRSRATAKALLDAGVSAIFDIHRDGASRNFYLTEHNGKKFSKIRLVVGQGNPSSEANLQFALWLVSVADTLYPWLIADIYMGSGKYNQDLSAKAMLFEMGCHKIEKDYVENSVPLLADVIYTTLFATTVEEESGNLTVGDTAVESENATIDEVLDQKNPTQKSGKMWLLVLGGVGIATLVGFVVRKKKLQSEK